MRNFLILFFSVELLLVGCTSTTAIPSPTIPATAQQLPITAEIKINDKTIKLEVAKTSQEQATGLMYRSDLPDDRGMLFPMAPARPVQFWMKNVPVALDMVFLHQGKIVSIASKVPPCTTPNCPSYGPQVLVDHVLELRSGRAAELGFKIGDNATIVNLK